MGKNMYLCAHGTPKLPNIKMKKTFSLLLSAAFTALTLWGTSSCHFSTSKMNDERSDSDSVTAVPDTASVVILPALPRTLADAPAPKGNIITWLVAGYNGDGGYKMFIVEGDDSRFIQDNLGTTDTLYVLRLVSYEQTKDEKEPSEGGGTYEEIEGNLVVDAYHPTTKDFVGRYEGQYSSGGEYDDQGELLHCGESYSGFFTKADGTKEEFSYYGD